MTQSKMRSIRTGAINVCSLALQSPQQFAALGLPRWPLPSLVAPAPSPMPELIPYPYQPGFVLP